LTEWAKSLLKGIGIFFSLAAAFGVAAYITLIVMVPREDIVVPDVVGKKLEEAIFLLSKSNLGTKITGERFSEEVPENFVLSQTPPPGTKVRKDRVVDLVISGGARSLSSPEVVGMKLREAKIYLSQFGISILNISYIYSVADEGEVIAQDPPEGSKMYQGRGINLLVSSGPPKLKLMMPNLIGENIDKVAQQLRKVSIKVAMVKEETSLKEKGTIIDQSPPAGSIIDENSRVELVVSTGSKEKIQVTSPERWILIGVDIPPGFGREKLSCVVIDEEGRKIFDYGMYSAGEKAWVSCEVIGKGEVRIYWGDTLLKVRKVEG